MSTYFWDFMVYMYLTIIIELHVGGNGLSYCIELGKKQVKLLYRAGRQRVKLLYRAGRETG